MKANHIEACNACILACEAALDTCKKIVALHKNHNNVHKVDHIFKAAYDAVQECITQCRLHLKECKSKDCTEKTQACIRVCEQCMDACDKSADLCDVLDNDCVNSCHQINWLCQDCINACDTCIEHSCNE